MRSYILCVTLVFSCLASLSIVHGYKIDQSCRKAGIYDEVERALHEAFDMAEAGIRALERAQVRGRKDPPDAPRVDNKWDEVPPRPKELQDLIKNIFAHDDIINESQQLPDVPEKEGAPYKQTLKKLKLERIYKAYKGILSEIRDPGNKDQLSWTDAIIYCDGSRYERKNGRWVYDKDNNVKRGFSGKLCSGPVASLYSLAETYSSAQQDNEQKTLTPNTIQICPPLIKEVKRSLEDKSPSYLKYKFRKIRSSISKSVAGDFRQIDVIGNSLAVTLLHEMTHTTAADDFDDVKVSGAGAFGFGRNAAYGWANVNKLAKTLPYADLGNKNACDNNADSAAYFALGCKLMSDAKDPRRITDDGILVPMDQPVNWTPNSWKRRWFEATGIPIP